QPALLTSTSTGPSAPVASATPRATEPASVTSSATARPRPPCPSTAASVSAAVSSRRSVTATGWPSPARAGAIARPMPPAPAVFGQAGPRVGSFDAGFGTAYLARVVGEKRAREIWMLCRRYDAETAERWGLVNRVVPAAELRAEVRRWADELLGLSPTALRF